MQSISDCKGRNIRGSTLVAVKIILPLLLLITGASELFGYQSLRAGLQMCSRKLLSAPVVITRQLSLPLSHILLVSSSFSFMITYLNPIFKKSKVLFHLPRNSFSILWAVDVIASPSLLVSLKQVGNNFPILLMESMTSSGKITLCTPAKAI